ncbi:MAG: hypothetical protein V4722_08530 [Bacteroidota bacterium]
MKFISLLAICFLSISSYGQSKKFTFKLGTEYDLPRKSEDLSFFGNDKDDIVNLSINKDELNISKFNAKDLTRSEVNSIPLTGISKKFKSEIVLDFANKHYWVYSDWDSKSDEKLLYYEKLDVAAGKMTFSKTKLLGTTNFGDSKGLYVFYNQNSYSYKFDRSRKKLLIYYRLNPKNFKDKINFDKIGIHVYDENMNRLWGDEFTMPYSEAMMNNIDYSIDSAGNAYLLAKVYDSEKIGDVNPETNKPGYHYEVMKFTKDSKQTGNIRVLPNNYFIQGIGLTENVDHSMGICGTFSSAANNLAEGIFWGKADDNNNVKTYNNVYYKFSLEEMKKYESAKTIKRMEENKECWLSYLNINEVIMEKDGSALFVCESYHRNFTQGEKSSTMYHYYDDIVAIKINSHRKCEWIKKIPKEQFGIDHRNTLSYKLISDTSGYHFLFLDNQTNTELSETQDPRPYKDGNAGQLVVTSISNAGVSGKMLLLDTKEDNAMVFPTSFTKVNGTKLVGLASMKSGNFKPLLITVE